MKDINDLFAQIEDEMKAEWEAERTKEAQEEAERLARVLARHEEVREILKEEWGELLDLLKPYTTFDGSHVKLTLPDLHPLHYSIWVPANMKKASVLRDISQYRRAYLKQRASARDKLLAWLEKDPVDLVAWFETDCPVDPQEFPEMAEDVAAHEARIERVHQIMGEMQAEKQQAYEEEAARVRAHNEELAAEVASEYGSAMKLMQITAGAVDNGKLAGVVSLYAMNSRQAAEGTEYAILDDKAAVVWRKVPYIVAVDAEKRHVWPIEAEGLKSRVWVHGRRIYVWAWHLKGADALIDEQELEPPRWVEEDDMEPDWEEVRRRLLSEGVA